MQFLQTLCLCRLLRNTNSAPAPRAESWSFQSHRFNSKLVHGAKVELERGRVWGDKDQICAITELMFYVEGRILSGLSNGWQWKHVLLSAQQLVFFIYLKSSLAFCSNLYSITVQKLGSRLKRSRPEPHVDDQKVILCRFFGQRQNNYLSVSSFVLLNLSLA